MNLTIESEVPPLRVDESGAVRVGKTRVLFALIVRAFQGGASPEDIVRAYDTLDLADVYAAVAYYLCHRPEVEQYLAEYDLQAEEIRLKIEERHGSQVGISERLLRRLAERRSPETSKNHKAFTA
jgi:uncharacterized protein (DUF433 family)